MSSRPVIVVALLLVLYVASYWWLSRRAYEQADEWHMHGFYYLTPQPTRSWELKQAACKHFYAPLNALDRALGTGRAPGGGLTWGLSR